MNEVNTMSPANTISTTTTISPANTNLGQTGSSMTGTSLYKLPQQQSYAGTTTGVATPPQSVYPGISTEGMKGSYQIPSQVGSSNKPIYAQRPINSYTSSLYGQRKRKPSKKKMIGLLLLLGIMVWICLGD